MPKTPVVDEKIPIHGRAFSRRTVYAARDPRDESLRTLLAYLPPKDCDPPNDEAGVAIYRSEQPSALGVRAMPGDAWTEWAGEPARFEAP